MPRRREIKCKCGNYIYTTFPKTDKVRDQPRCRKCGERSAD